MEKINIAELLRDCPTGMELDCMIYEDVYFDYIDELNIIHCYIQHDTHKTSITFNQHGTPNSDIKSKCVIFPKGKTTWKGFHRPFRDGDVVVAEDNESFQLFLLEHLTHGKNAKHYNGNCYFGWNFKYHELFEKGIWSFDRLATQEEKAKLFDAIKVNGYKWNAETKTLEKLIKPMFKVGDRIKSIYNSFQYDITELTDTHYTLVEVEDKFKYTEDIIEDKNWELVPNKFDITALKPFDKVLIRSSNAREWVATLYSHYSNNKFYGCGMCCDQCIPYEGNEHLLGTTNDCDDFYKT